jgi:hypothetical protein
MEKSHCLGDPLSPAIGWRVPLGVAASELRQTEKGYGFFLLKMTMKTN